MAATRASHRAVAAILLLAMAVGTAQASATEAGADTGGADGHGATPTTPSARVPPPAVTVRCTKVHVVKAGETCASVAQDWRLTVTQFMVLNQDQGYTCGAAPLPHGRWVCVRGSAVG